MITQTEDPQVFEMFRRIVGAELDNWVPNASQSLIKRAAAILGQPLVKSTRSLPEPEADHGPDRIAHSLFPTWVAGYYVVECTGCHRLFPA